MNCPSRRRPILYSVYAPNYNGGSNVAYLCDAVTAVARTDYAANGGDTDLSQLFVSPPVPYQQGDAPGYPWYSVKLFSGICFLRSEVRLVDITDGTSNTYMVGEKYIDEDYYFTGQDIADDQSLFCGWNNDNVRTSWPGWPTPMQDRTGFMCQGLYGSAHGDGLNMAFCDGSVQWVSYSIDKETYCRLGNRKDGLTVDGKRL
jgi:prepilin-type processing-associated H-X9-DG protein